MIFINNNLNTDEDYILVEYLFQFQTRILIIFSTFIAIILTFAFLVLDSSGNPPSGILEGTLTDFGSFEQCIDLKVPSNDGPAIC